VEEEEKLKFFAKLLHAFLFLASDVSYLNMLLLLFIFHSGISDISNLLGHSVCKLQYSQISPFGSVY
jgi:hypothetical protein